MTFELKRGNIWQYRRSINLNLFDKVTKDNFELDDNKILVIKKQNDINSDLLITPLIHDFIINNHNSKYLLAIFLYFSEFICEFSDELPLLSSLFIFLILISSLFLIEFSFSGFNLFSFLSGL